MGRFEKYLPYFVELRRRILYCLCAFLVLFILLFIFSSELYTFVAQPILKNLPFGGKLIATHVTTPFTVPLKLALWTAFLILFPYILYQCWQFIAPALYLKEKKILLPTLVASISLFYVGIFFAHFIILPLALGFFTQLVPKGVTLMTDITYYLDFVLALYLGFGVAFQVPIITFLFIRLQLIFIEALQKRRPYIIVGAFIIGMLLTPPDVLSQILLAVPLLILFEAGLLLAKWLPALSSAKEIRSLQ